MTMATNSKTPTPEGEISGADFHKPASRADYMTDQLSHDQDDWMPLTRGERWAAVALLIGFNLLAFSLAFSFGYWMGTNA